MAGSVISSLAPHIAITSLTVFATNAFRSLSSIFLVDLNVYRLPEDEKEGAVLNKLDREKRGQKSTVRLRGSKKNQKHSESQQDIDESLLMIKTTQDSLMVRSFYADFDRLCFFIATVISNVASLAVFRAYHPKPQSGAVLTAIATFSALSGIATLFSVQFDSKTAPALEQQISMAVGIVSSWIGLAATLVAPEGLLDFDFNESTAALATAMQYHLEKSKSQPLYSNLWSQVSLSPHEMSISPLFIPLVLVITSAIVGAVVVSPAVRCSRCYNVLVTNSSSETGLPFVGASFLLRAVLHLNFIWPFLNVVLWIRPLSEDAFQFLGIPAAQLQIVRVISVAGAAALQICLVRPLLSGYLSTGVLAWNELVHGSVSSAETSAEYKTRSNYVRLKLETNNVLLCRVAVQLLCPAVMLLSLAALQWSKSLPDQASFTIDPPLVPDVVFITFSSYLSWWVTLIWTIANAITLSLFRKGVLR